jgi:hypothetical protein
MSIKTGMLGRAVACVRNFLNASNCVYSKALRKSTSASQCMHSNRLKERSIGL